jgi:hypothetical protein
VEFGLVRGEVVIQIVPECSIVLPSADVSCALLGEIDNRICSSCLTSAADVCPWSASGRWDESVEAVFLLLLVFVAVFAGLARRLKIPYPILLVIAGLVLSFLPEMPRIGLDPNLVFLVFLPPLLYSAAWTL